MFIKATAIGLALVSTPILATPMILPQDKPQAPTDGESSTTAPVPVKLRDGTGTDEAALRDEITRLREQLEAAKRTQAKLHGELQEALDMIVKSTRVDRRRHNCTPSRSRSLLTYYQWMDERGHKKRAEQLVGTVIQEYGDDLSRLNSLAWNLMTEKGLAGKFHGAALRITQRMRQHRRLRHQHMDTIALAHFLNGDVKTAVEQQRAALQHNKSSEYRRRLMVYEAALKNGTAASRTVEVVAGGDD